MQKTRCFVTFSHAALHKKSAFFKRFVDIIEQCGCSIPYRWFDHGKDGSCSSASVYECALRAIQDSDLVIAEVSMNSTGVGQQIVYAIQQRKSILLCLQKKYEHGNVHTFLRGTRSRNVSFLYYDSLPSLQRDIRAWLSKERDFSPQLEKFNFLTTQDQKFVLAETSKKLRISQSELLRTIVDEWIKHQKKKAQR